MNVNNVTLHHFGQTVWGHIWKYMLEKSQTILDTFRVWRIWECSRNFTSWSRGIFISLFILNLDCKAFSFHFSFLKWVKQIFISLFTSQNEWTKFSFHFSLLEIPKFALAGHWHMSAVTPYLLCRYNHSQDIPQSGPNVVHTSSTTVCTASCPGCTGRCLKWVWWRRDAPVLARGSRIPGASWPMINHLHGTPAHHPPDTQTPSIADAWRHFQPIPSLKTSWEASGLNTMRGSIMMPTNR